MRKQKEKAKRIVLLGNPILRQVAEPVRRLDKRIKELVEKCYIAWKQQTVSG